ncbi:phage tail tube protein [Roseomonas mucosa]|uniref:phage tail tube protein n=1 Tax=Roseomonas mucosa TaxID=207340 RepID=UPI001EF53C7E|nr:phage tail tube protein [Roseomonas mucosa]MCG7357139.1 phage tail tube protein [Roseomonas mucosa]
MSGSVLDYQAGVESTEVVLSYAAESTWKVAPSVPTRILRMTGESLAGTKTRNRPQEIESSRQASPAVTTARQAGGGINFALSSGTYDGLFPSLMGSDWTADLAITGTNIAAAAAGNQLTGPAGTFNAVQVKQWVRIEGDGAWPAANAGFFFVSAKASDGSSITLRGGTLVNAAAGPAVRVRGSMIRNGRDVKTLYFQKELRDKWLRYPGCLVSGFTLNLGQGDFGSGSWTLIAADQFRPDTQADFGTGAQIAAPTGRIHDSVDGFKKALLDEVEFDSAITGVSLTVTREGAAQDYAMGSPESAGVRAGTLTASGTVRAFFRTWAQYENAEQEIATRFSFGSFDPDGAGYMFTLHSAVLVNPQFVAGARDSAVTAEYTLEGNPGADPNCTIQIDRFGKAGI